MTHDTAVFATSNFLVPNGTFIVELVAFVIVLVVIGRFVLPVVNRQIERRQEEIRSSLEAAQAARAEAEATRREREAILEEAKREAREIIAQAHRTAEELRAEGEARGREEHDRLVAAGHAAVDQARREALEEVARRVGELVMAATRQVLRREVDEAAHRDLVEQAIAALRREAGASEEQEVPAR
jgi:F-type H+-transporting ATPase subunit b